MTDREMLMMVYGFLEATVTADASILVKLNEHLFSLRISVIEPTLPPPEEPDLIKSSPLRVDELPF